MATLTPTPAPSPTLRHRLEYGLFRLMDGILGRLPMATVQTLGEGAGSLFYLVDPRHRRIVRENLRFADLGLSEAETRALSHACFRHFGGLFVSLLRLRHATPEELDRWIKVEGLEHFDAVQAAGKGFIQLTGHYGNWEAVALAQSRLGRTIDAIGRELDNPLLEPISLGFRTRFGNRVILKDGAMRDTLKALKAGRGVGFLLDQDALTSGVFVRFLGQWASTFSTAGSLAARYDLPVLPVFSWPNPDGTTTVRFEAPFHVPATGDAAKDAWVATQLMTARIEAQIRKDPRWWFWMHRRFKTRPGEGHPLPAPLPPQEWVESIQPPLS
ncbi:lysophospholipid acyltransferase family protein [Geothrix fermentans]|uniref:lysophospholipid acyltransferase family protein n=1 Tax=Geothrix fermentans TaxID=44676 RepID=UPI0004298975|nr:lysophospholipid acyltransferase family protein [Geothrix fermentans]